jgi:hypothetical protein
MTTKRRERALDHIHQVTDIGTKGRQYRRQILNPPFSQISPVQFEDRRPDQYTPAELLKFVTENPKWAEVRTELLQQLSTNAVIRQMVALELYERDQRLYQPSDKVFDLQGDDGILRRAATNLFDELQRKRGVVTWAFSVA